jgi:mannose-6-phosphate isomerase-like protein (cupin superfamily)
MIPEVHRRDGREVEVLASCRQFQTERLSLAAGESYAGRCNGETLELWCVLSGEVEVHWSGEPIACTAVHWVMLPAELGRFELRTGGGSTLLRVFTPTPGAEARAGRAPIVTRQ